MRLRLLRQVADAVNRVTRLAGGLLQFQTFLDHGDFAVTLQGIEQRQGKFGGMSGSKSREDILLLFYSTSGHDVPRHLV